MRLAAKAELGLVYHRVQERMLIIGPLPTPRPTVQACEVRDGAGMPRKELRPRPHRCTKAHGPVTHNVNGAARELRCVDCGSDKAIAFKPGGSVRKAVG
jgi:hypothetical protein